MTNKISEDGVEIIDGRAVGIYDAKLVNAFDLSPDIAQEWAGGDLVAMIVLARVELPKFTNIKKSGDVKKTAQLRSEDVIPLTVEKAYHLLQLANTTTDVIYNPVTVSQGEPQLGFDPKELEM